MEVPGRAGQNDPVFTNKRYQPSLTSAEPIKHTGTGTNPQPTTTTNHLLPQLDFLISTGERRREGRGLALTSALAVQKGRAQKSLQENNHLFI